MPQIAQAFDKKGGRVYGFRSPTKALGEKRGSGGVMDIFVGMGFRTDDNMLGVVKTVDVKGRITQWRELWNQDIMNTFPCTVQAMRRFYVLETDRERQDTIEAFRIASIFLL